MIVPCSDADMWGAMIKCRGVGVLAYLTALIQATAKIPAPNLLIFYHELLVSVLLSYFQVKAYDCT